MFSLFVPPPDLVKAMKGAKLLTELKIGDKLTGKNTKDTYEFLGVLHNPNSSYAKYVLRELKSTSIYNVTRESLVDNYIRVEKPEVVKVSIPERRYGVSVSEMLQVDFGTLERRVIADMVRAHQMEHQRRLLKHLYSPQVQFSVPKDLSRTEFNLVNFLIPPVKKEQSNGNKSDGSSADYYKLPDKATQLQDLISHKDMNAQMGEIFRAAYRYGQASHSDQLRDAKKIKYYIEAEIKRLESM